MKRTILLLSALLLTQCASFEKSVGLGVGLGAAAGFATSQAVNYNAKGVVFLGVTGALLGGVVGALLHRDGAKEIAPQAFSVLKNNPPPLRSAEKDVLWVPDRIEGDRFEEGHRVFTIKKQAHWQLRDGENSEDEGGSDE
ncbi:MAG: hypothetical protein HYZ71_06815 [Deltaproteobacteria bacterium]|nr:hypothetical protein [Deltaproteobacteria bacterium]